MGRTHEGPAQMAVSRGITLSRMFPVDEGKRDAKPVMRWHAVAGIALFHGFRYGVELGVSGGRFTSFLCATIHDMHMTAVDLWQEQPQNNSDGSQTYLADDGWKHEEAFQNFKESCRLFFPGRVKIMRMSTLDAAKMVEDESVDFVFIDADHSYEGCKGDIDAWLPKVRKNGMLCGHDYNWPTVKQAVDERGWRTLTVAPDNVWIHFVR